MIKKQFARMIAAGWVVMISLSVISCSKELKDKDALVEIAAGEEFQKPYYAPMRVGELTLTGSNFKDTEGYIRKHYGNLLDAGLVTVEEASRNSWSVTLDIQLTDKGLDMSDPRRGGAKEAYVAVCRMVPVRVDSLRVIAEGNIMECDYTFEQQEITPFGVYRGFEQGRQYQDTRTFVRARGSWRVK